jgi:hypothetical protein
VSLASWQQFQADLHVHTALSPCAGNEMTPPAIVAAALRAGLHLVAICDHNTAGNVAAVQQAAGERLAVLAGIEITTAEEAHVLGLFPTVEKAQVAASELRPLVPDADDAYQALWGEELLLDAEGKPIGHETKALTLASSLSVGDTVRLIHRHGGRAIAAHVDRAAFGVVAQLGFFPATAGFDAAELSWRLPASSPLPPELAAIGLPLTGASDAHYLADVGRARTRLTAAAATFGELAAALKGQDGRSVCRA